MCALRLLSKWLNPFNAIKYVAFCCAVRRWHGRDRMRAIYFTEMKVGEREWARMSLTGFLGTEMVSNFLCEEIVFGFFVHTQFHKISSTYFPFFL